MQQVVDQTAPDSQPLRLAQRPESLGRVQLHEFQILGQIFNKA